jgi:hypothetical protein
MEQSPFYRPISKYIICMHENIIVPLLRVYGGLDVLVVISFAAATAEGHGDLSMIDESLIVRSRVVRTISHGDMEPIRQGSWETRSKRKVCLLPG